jgi:hypothetical protein
MTNRGTEGRSAWIPGPLQVCPDVECDASQSIRRGFEGMLEAVETLSDVSHVLYIVAELPKPPSLDLDVVVDWLHHVIIL